jgi:hypothetical protein
VADAFATELTQKIAEKVSDSLPGILLSKAGLIRIWRNKPRLNHRYKIKIDVQCLTLQYAEYMIQ